MKGAVNLQCRCGGFLETVYRREQFGKHIHLQQCTCGYAIESILDGDELKVKKSKNGLILSNVRLNGLCKYREG